MRDIYLDCSGLHNIRLESQLPSTIEIDGRIFTQELQSLMQDFVMANQKTPEQKRWELIVALAGNSGMWNARLNRTGQLIENEAEFAEAIIYHANAIMKELDA